MNKLDTVQHAKATLLKEPRPDQIRTRRHRFGSPVRDRFGHIFPGPDYPTVLHKTVG